MPHKNCSCRWGFNLFLSMAQFDNLMSNLKLRTFLQRKTKISRFLLLSRPWSVFFFKLAEGLDFPWLKRSLHWWNLLCQICKRIYKITSCHLQCSTVTVLGKMSGVLIRGGLKPWHDFFYTLNISFILTKTHLLLTEFEGRPVSYGLQFFSTSI